MATDSRCGAGGPPESRRVFSASLDAADRKYGRRNWHRHKAVFIRSAICLRRFSIFCNVSLFSSVVLYISVSPLSLVVFFYSISLCLLLSLSLSLFLSVCLCRIRHCLSYETHAPHNCAIAVAELRREDLHRLIIGIMNFVADKCLTLTRRHQELLCVRIISIRLLYQAP